MQIDTQEFQKAELERQLLKAKMQAALKVAALAGGLSAPLLWLASDYAEIRAQAHVHATAAASEGTSAPCRWWEWGCED